MNIFLPYPNNIYLSVRSLDDKRLNKQILETFQILQVSKGLSEGYKNHPIIKHYIKFPKFLNSYGYLCCEEYKYRFNKTHKLFNKFNLYSTPWYIPFYAAGSINTPECIRTTDNVGELYKQKLIDKWESDKFKGRPSKWTNRDIPNFYSEFCISK